MSTTITSFTINSAVHKPKDAKGVEVRVDTSRFNTKSSIAGQLNEHNKTLASTCAALCRTYTSDIATTLDQSSLASYTAYMNDKLGLSCIQTKSRTLVPKTLDTPRAYLKSNGALISVCALSEKSTSLAGAVWTFSSIVSSENLRVNDVAKEVVSFLKDWRNKSGQELRVSVTASSAATPRLQCYALYYFVREYSIANGYTMPEVHTTEFARALWDKFSPDEQTALSGMLGVTRVNRITGAQAGPKVPKAKHEMNFTA